MQEICAGLFSERGGFSERRAAQFGNGCNGAPCESAGISDLGHSPPPENDVPGVGRCSMNILDLGMADCHPPCSKITTTLDKQRGQTCPKRERPEIFFLGCLDIGHSKWRPSARRMRCRGGGGRDLEASESTHSANSTQVEGLARSLAQNFFQAPESFEKCGKLLLLWQNMKKVICAVKVESNNDAVLHISAVCAYEGTSRHAGGGLAQRTQRSCQISDLQPEPIHNTKARRRYFTKNHDRQPRIACEDWEGPSSWSESADRQTRALHALAEAGGRALWAVGGKGGTVTVTVPSPPRSFLDGAAIAHLKSTVEVTGDGYVKLAHVADEIMILAYGMRVRLGTGRLLAEPGNSHASLRSENTAQECSKYQKHEIALKVWVASERESVLDDKCRQADARAAGCRRHENN
ncbi:hypothetical protein BKA62DRAFT_672297 [Auriculariales sp. MPI-PUGE-AT-0066]|nr:hypothetical protein BKA62DRAFT_672297 [Auriculariales sp. MPI-PUGE-AT-0066]